MNYNDFDTSQKYQINVHSLDSQEMCLRFIWVHSEDLILYFCEVSKSLEFITF